MSNTPLPDVVEQVPAGGGLNRPESGVYGEDAAQQRLQSALPGMDAQQPQEVAPLPPMPEGPTPAIAPPAGLPRGLLAPTRQPDVPVGTPLGQPQIFVGSDIRRRIALLESLVSNPEVSAETQEWATMVLSYMRSANG